MGLKYIEDKSKLNEVNCRLIRDLIIWILSYVILVMCDLNVYLKWIIGVGIYIMFWADTFRTLIPNTYIFLLKIMVWIFEKVKRFYERNKV